MHCDPKARLKVESLIKPIVERGLKIINAILSNKWEHLFIFPLYFCFRRAYSNSRYRTSEAVCTQWIKAWHRDNANCKKTDNNRAANRTNSSRNRATIYRFSEQCSTTELMDTMCTSKRGTEISVFYSRLTSWTKFHVRNHASM